MSYLDKIKSLNNYQESNKVPFLIDGIRVGQVLDSSLELVLNSGFFKLDGSGLTLIAKDYNNRNRDLQEFAKYLLNLGVINRIMDEPYALSKNFNDKPLALVDRACATTLGINSYGVHINGYFKDNNSIKMWIATRAKNKGFEAGKLDHIAAGGQPYGISPIENAQKECFEEASIPYEISKNLILTGYVSYKFEYSKGGSKDTIFCYDLELPKDFTPKINDDEVEKFELMDIKDVAKLVDSSDRFKLNCNLVIIDFLIRHGVLSQNHKEYFDIVKGLRV